MIDRLIEDEKGRRLAVSLIEDRKLPFRLTLKDGRKRSVEQNRLQWLWAAEAAEQRQDVSIREVHSEWKLRFGVPILCAENPPFAAAWKFAEQKLSWEEQLELMSFVSVTSIMTMTQQKNYLDRVLQWNTERGIELTDPEDLKWGKP